MKPFLRQVADHYFASARATLFVFPNRRSQVFFKKYFGEKMLEDNVGASIPQLTTVSDLFKDIYAPQGVQADELTLLVELYDVYREVKIASDRVPDSLDDFLFWGSVILSDFGDIDKYLADPVQILTNIAQYKDIEVDPEEFTTTAQYDAIRALIGSLKGNEGNFSKEYHKNFIAIWDMLLPIYEKYNAALKDKGLAYEGMIFRYVAEDPTGSKARLQSLYPNVSKVVFVGLNALSNAELTFMHSLAKENGFAEFCWDFPTDPKHPSPLLSDPQNKASHFIGSYIRYKDNITGYLPQAFPVEYGPLPEISVISTGTTVAGSKLIPSFLETAGGTVDERTLVLLPDETQLQSVLTSIPGKEGDVINVTMGSPLSISGSFSLFNAILRLFDSKRPGYYYHRVIWDIFSSTIFKCAHEEYNDRIADIKDKAQTYIPQQDLDFSPVFRNLPDRSSIDAVIDYLLETIGFLASRMSLDQLEREAMYEIYRVLNYLKTHSLHTRYTDLRFETFRSLLQKLLSRVSIPYNGEPLCGLQVMGPLEVRALDFDNVMILSASEAVFPRKNVADTFIPYTIRKAFGLPTYEEQDAIWAYYFYRLISRAKNVWMVYNSTADGIQSGEPSRYIMQLKYAYRDKVSMKFYNHEVISSVSAGYNCYTNDRPYDGKFSASSLQKYLECPLAFYYRYIKGINDDDESVSEDVEANKFGTAIHETMEALYGGFTDEITRDDIEKMDYGPVVRKHLSKALNISEDAFEGKPFIALEQAKQFVKEILEEDKAYAPFKIIGLEQKIVAKFEDYMLTGTIDRIDIKDGIVRIVDYKTGKYYTADINPVADAGTGTAEDAFSNPDMDKWPKISIQLFIYDWLWKALKNDETKVYVKDADGKDRESQDRKETLQKYTENNFKNSIYCPYMLSLQRAGVTTGDIPKTHDGVFSKEVFNEYHNRLKSLMDEISNTAVKFGYRDGCKHCKNCKYGTLCRK